MIPRWSLLEYCATPLPPLDAVTSRTYIKQLCIALTARHDGLALGAPHAGLLFEDLQLDADFQLMLPPSVEEGGLAPTIGGLLLQAPEAAAGLAYDGRRADAWSLGVITFCLVTGAPPFAGAACPFRAAVMQRNWLWWVQAHAGRADALLHNASLAWLVTGLLEPDPARRITFEQALASPWIFGFTLSPAQLLEAMRARHDALAAALSGGA